MNCIIVDDDEFILRLLTHEFQELGFEIWQINLIPIEKNGLASEVVTIVREMI